MSQNLLAEPAAAPKKSSRGRLVLGGGLMLFVAASALYLALAGRARDAEIDRVTAALDRDDPGWRLGEILAARAEAPDDENSAALVRGVKTASPRGFVGDDLARVAEVPADERLTRVEAALLRDGLDANAAAVLTARALAALPRGRHRLSVDENNPWATILQDQQHVRHAALVLRLDALRRAREGRADAAVVSARACLNASASVSDEPFVISAYIRWAVRAVAANAAEQALAHAEASAEELARFAAALRESEDDPGYLRAVRGERAVLFAAALAMRRGRLRFGDAGVALDPWLAFEDRYLGWFVRARVGGDIPGLLRFHTEWADVARLADHDQPAREADLYGRSRQFVSGPMYAAGMLLDPRRAGTGYRRTKAHVRCARVACAVERYRLATGAWPRSLAALVPAYLDAVPDDPGDGKPVRYKREADGITVYAVGDNLKDDGGDTMRRRAGGTPADVGFRLWDSSARQRRRAEELDAPSPE